MVQIDIGYYEYFYGSGLGDFLGWVNMDRDNNEVLLKCVVTRQDGKSFRWQEFLLMNYIPVKLKKVNF